MFTPDTTGGMVLIELVHGQLSPGFLDTGFEPWSDQAPASLAAGAPLDAPEMIPAGAMKSTGPGVWSAQENSRTSQMESFQMNYRLITAAADFAAQVHATQRRKGEAAEPYFNHLAQVANLVAEAGADADLIAAAYLHDSIEDQAIPADAIAQRFGNEVQQLVLEVTDDKSLPKAQRKAAQLAHAPHMSRKAKMLKIADKISNLSSLLLSPPPTWSTAQRRGYADWAAKVVDACRSGHPQLAIQFDLLHAQLLKELLSEDAIAAQAHVESLGLALVAALIEVDELVADESCARWAPTLHLLSASLLKTKHDLLNTLTPQEPDADLIALRRAHQWAAEALSDWDKADAQLERQGWPVTDASRKLSDIKANVQGRYRLASEALGALASA